MRLYAKQTFYLTFTNRKSLSTLQLSSIINFNVFFHKYIYIYLIL